MLRTIFLFCSPYPSLRPYHVGQDSQNHCAAEGEVCLSTHPKTPLLADKQAWYSFASQLIRFSRIAEGNFYEAHQQLRVITARYLKSQDYASACDVLYNGSLLLLRAGQGGSGGDLALMLLNDVYIKGEWECNQGNKNRVLEVFHAFPREEPTRKRFVSEMVGWSGRYGELERGDSEIHHEVGRVYAEGQ